MNRYALFLTTTLAVFCLTTSAVTAHNHDFNVLTSNSNGKITTENGNVIIHSDTHTTARITPDGSLTIEGKNQAVNRAQRQLLIQYVATVNDIERKGMQLAGAAPGFAAGVVVDVFAGLFSGESEDDISKAANRRAHDFAHKALPICQGMQNLEHTQDELAAGMPVFKPYAVIEAHDVDDCEHDINSDD